MQLPRWYVATDRNGVQQLRAGALRWPLPPPGSPFTPADAESPECAIELADADGLLERLDERIFVAEPVGAATGGGGTVVVKAARLIAEAPWDVEGAAAFALDALEHAFSDQLDLALPRGQSLGRVLVEARSALASGGAPGGFAGLGRFSRLRQLRRLRALLGSTALSLAKEDEREDLDILDDPAWATLAALGEGVLAALEALRSAVAPRYVQATEDREAPEERSRRVFDLQTPWGPLTFGGEHVPDHEPAARCARDALERARQAVGDRDGEEAGRAERAWQAEALDRLLRA